MFSRALSVLLGVRTEGIVYLSHASGHLAIHLRDAGLGADRSVDGAYMLEEQRILLELFHSTTGRRRLPLTADRRRRLAVKDKELTAKERKACCHIVRPEAIVARYRQFGARKYDSSRKRKLDRRGKPAESRKLVLRLADENLRWGYTKIRDALGGLNVEIGRTTVANILSEAGIDQPRSDQERARWRLFSRVIGQPSTLATSLVLKRWASAGSGTWSFSSSS